METVTKREESKCPKCGERSGQMNNGHNRSGTQRRICSSSNATYTIKPKKHAYPEEIRNLAIKEYMMGKSARGVGKIHGMSGNNVLFWIKKQETVWISPKTDFSVFELDEIFWFIERRKSNENGINTYLMTMISRKPRQIVAFGVDKSVNSKAIQILADSVPAASEYCTDGNTVYMDVMFGDIHRRNIHDKKDTYNIESTNADLRHHIKALSRKSRCFFRTVETLNAVLSLFIDAYNKFGEMKLKSQVPVIHTSSAKASAQIPLSIFQCIRLFVTQRN